MRKLRPLKVSKPRYTPLIDDTEACCHLFQLSKNMGGNDGCCSVIPIHRCNQAADVCNALQVKTVDSLIAGQIVEKVPSDEEVYFLPVALQVGFCAFSGDGNLTICKIGQTENNLKDCGLARAVFSISL